MLASPKMKMVEELVAGSSKEELIWLNGYFSGLLATAPNATTAQPVCECSAKNYIGLWQRNRQCQKAGNGPGRKNKSKGITPKLVSLEQYRLSDLQKESHFYVIISTQGEGEPPLGAKKFYDHIHANGFRLKI